MAEEEGRLDEIILVTNKDYEVLEVVMSVIKTKDKKEAFFYICDLNDIVQKYHLWINLMPRIKPFYAVKCNTSPLVVRVLAACGVGFDCASREEIRTIIEFGINPDRIIFAHVAKIPSHIEYAVSVGVHYTTFDCQSELLKCKKLYRNVKMLIRIKCDAHRATIKLGLKYGCEAPKLLQLARTLKVDVVGVAFHVGSGCKEPYAFHRAIEVSNRAFDCGESLGFKFNLLDIGGGVPGDDNFTNAKQDCVKDKMYRTVIFGPTCDSTDMFCYDVLLPKLDIGDWLVFKNRGDYSLALANTFNGFRIPKVYTIADENTQSILKRPLNDIRIFKNFERQEDENKI